MVENTKKFILDNYIEIATLNSEGNVKLVQNSSDNSICVKKAVRSDLLPVYEKIKNSGLSSFSEILFLIAEENRLIVIEEFAPGKHLQQYIELNGVMTVEVAEKCILSLCDAVEYLHKNKIIHRDLSPRNIIISSDLHPKIIDFDISRFNSGEKSMDTVVLGTVGFAAPEQFGFTETDAMSDIYSLGAVFNYMLTGKLPKDGLPKDKKSARIIKKCVDLAPDRRYKSVAELKNDLLDKRLDNGRIIASSLIVLFSIPFILSFFKTDNFDYALKQLYSYLMIIVLPFLLWSDFLHWQKYVKPFENMNRITKNVLIGILWFAIFYIITEFIPLS